MTPAEMLAQTFPTRTRQALPRGICESAVLHGTDAFAAALPEESPTLRLVSSLLGKALSHATSTFIQPDKTPPPPQATTPSCLLEVQGLMNRILYDRAQPTREGALRISDLCMADAGGTAKRVEFPSGLAVHALVRGGMLYLQSLSAAGCDHRPTVHVDDRVVHLQEEGLLGDGVPQHLHQAAVPVSESSTIKIVNDGYCAHFDSSLQVQEAEREPSAAEKEAIDVSLSRLHNQPEYRTRYLEPAALADSIRTSGKKVVAFSGFVNSGYCDDDVLCHMLGKVLDGLDPEQYTVLCCGFTSGIGVAARLAKERGFETVALRAKVSGEAPISPYVDRYTLSGYTWEEAAKAYGELASLGHLVVIGGNRFSELEALTALQSGGSVTNVPYYTDGAGNLAGTHSLQPVAESRFGVATNAHGILQRILSRVDL